MLNQALIYLSKGFSIIPIRPKSKEPLLSWQEFQKRRATEKEIREWFVKWPQMNLGIVTGVISNIAVIDLDGPEGIIEANRLGIQSKISSITGNGKHLWYSAKDIVSNAVKIHPGIDIRGEGGYVVAPPSIHENGKRYRWLNKFDRNLLKEFPAVLFQQNVLIQNVKNKEEGWIAKALQEMKDGNIDNTLTSVLGRLRHDGYSEEDARSFLEPHCRRVGAEDGHLEEKIKHIWKSYESAKRTESITKSTYGSSLIIHSPTNPDSIKQFEQLRCDMENGGRDGQLCTGYPKLDELCFRGLKSSRLFTVAARTGTGKTNWLIGVARTLCEFNRRVLIFSTETPYTEFWQRYIATLQDPNSFNKHQLFVCDSFAPNLEKVEEAINEIRPDLFIFDHINHVAEDPRELGVFMQGLNFLRRKYDCAGIISAQLNRSADWVDLKSGEKVTPRMSMIKGSGTIEQASSRVLLLSETRVTPEGTEIVGNLDKNDNGDKGLIHFILKKNPYRMVEL